MRSFSAMNGEGHGHKTTDALLGQFEVENTHTIIALTSGGSFVFLPVHQIPEKKWKETGVHFSTFVQYDTSERIVYAFGVDKFVVGHEQLLLASRDGFIKRIDVADMQMQRFSKASVAMNLKDNDELIGVQKIAANDDMNVVLITADGYYNYFSVSEVPVAGLKAQGVRSMKLGADDGVATMYVGYDTDSLVVFTDKLTQKRISLGTLTYTGRYKKGARVIRTMKTQKYQIIGSVAFGMTANLIGAEQTEQVIIDKLPLADLETVGKKFDFTDTLQHVAGLEVETIGSEVYEKETKTVAKTSDKVADDFQKFLEEQGVLFDED